MLNRGDKGVCGNENKSVGRSVVGHNLLGIHIKEEIKFPEYDSAFLSAQYLVEPLSVVSANWAICAAWW